MLHQDYLVRMFMQLASAIRESILKTRGGGDAEAAAELLDASLINATEIDGSLLLSLAPESMAVMLQLSESDPRLMGYMARTLLLSSRYWEEAGQHEQARLRAGQAQAVAQTFGFELNEAAVEPDELERFFQATLPA